MKTKKPEPLKPGTEAVRAYRARHDAAGGRSIYADVSAESGAALDAIMLKRGLTKKQAIEFALLRTARDLARVR